MRSFGDRLNVDAIKRVLKKEFPAVIAVAPQASNYVMVRDAANQELTHIINLRGIDPAHTAVSNLARIILPPAQNIPLATLLDDSAILIGKSMADQFDLAPGDTVELFYIQGQPTTKKVTLSQSKARIAGLFKTGIQEFDTGVVLGSLTFFKKLFPDVGITTLGLKLAPDVPEQSMITKLQKRFGGLDLFSWKQMYPALLAALKLEKYAMFVILALITLIASMNIISLLFMFITQKRGDIAILKTLGMANRSITQLFMIIGIGIATVAAATGLLGAWLVGLLLERYPFIRLPDVYYVSHLPIQMEWQIFAAVFLVVLLMSSIATLIATRRTRTINIARVLRYEG